LREKPVEIGARIVRHGSHLVFQVAEVAVSAGAARQNLAPDQALTGATGQAGGSPLFVPIALDGPRYRGEALESSSP
jgi:hypothetical protein